MLQYITQKRVLWRWKKKKQNKQARSWAVSANTWTLAAIIFFYPYFEIQCADSVDVHSAFSKRKHECIDE